MTLTERQQREREYHVEHARNRKPVVEFEVVESNRRRWWNAYWDTWTYLKDRPYAGKTVLVVGCGDGVDALYFARLGATVEAFDLSPDMLEIGRELAASNGLSVSFKEAPCESIPYPDNSFDLVYVRDILHHVEIPVTMSEIARVAKPGAHMLVNEIYSHSITDKIRYSKLVNKILYPALRSFVYGSDDPYITEDERKMTERDVAIVERYVNRPERQYFYFLVTRILPETSRFFSKCDRVLMMLLGWFGRYFAGRIVVMGDLHKHPGR